MRQPPRDVDDGASLTTSFENGAGTVVAVGVLDMRSAGRLDRELVAARGSSGWGAVVLDLRGVTHLDSSVIPGIVRAHEHAQRGGGGFAIHTTHDITRFFKVAGLDETLAFI